MIASLFVPLNYRITLKAPGLLFFFFTKFTWFTGRNALGAVCTHQPFIYWAFINWGCLYINGFSAINSDTLIVLKHETMFLVC